MFFQCMAEGRNKKLSSNPAWKQEKNAFSYILVLPRIVLHPQILRYGVPPISCSDAFQPRMQQSGQEKFRVYYREDCCCGTPLASSPESSPPVTAALHNLHCSLRFHSCKGCFLFQKARALLPLSPLQSCTAASGQEGFCSFCLVLGREGGRGAGLAHITLSRTN